MKMYSLDNYSLTVASRYLNSFEDHKNLTLISKRMERNMENFHYNPISVNSETIRYFPNVETLHTYEYDEHLFPPI